MKKFIFILFFCTGCSGIQLYTDFSPQAKGNFNNENYYRIIITSSANLEKNQNLILPIIEKYLKSELFKTDILPEKQGNKKIIITNYARNKRSNAVVLVKKAVILNKRIKSISIEIYDPYGGTLIEADYSSKVEKLPSKVIYRIFNEIFFENQNYLDQKDNDHKKLLFEKS